MPSHLPLLTVITIAGSLAACGGSDASPATTIIAETPPTTSAVTAPTAPRTTAAPTTTPTTPPPVTTVTPPGDADIDVAVVVWTDAWAAATHIDTTIDDIDGVESITVAETIRALTGVDTAGTDVDMTHQIVTAQTTPDGGIGIVDCALLEPHANTPIPTQHLTGTLAPIDGAWAITDVTYHDGGCIPADTNDDILTAYHAYWEALEASGNPPDPNHPTLTETMAGDQLEVARTALQRLQNEGATYIGIPELQPMVSNLTDGGRRAVVLDCIQYDEQFGTFNASSERLWPIEQGPKPMVFELEHVNDNWFVTQRDDSHDACYGPGYALEILG